MDAIQQTKIENIENLLNLIRELNYLKGFPYYNEEYRKRRTLYNPLLINTLIVFMNLREFVSPLFAEDFYRLLIGETFYIKELQILKLTYLQFSTMLILVQLVVYYKQRMAKFIEISEFNQEHSTKIINRLRLLEKFISWYFFAIGLIIGSILLLAIISSFIQLIIIGLFWSILFAVYNRVIAEMFVWNFCFFLLFVLYSKQLLNEMIKNWRLF